MHRHIFKDDIQNTRQNIKVIDENNALVYSVVMMATEVKLLRKPHIRLD